MGRSRETAVSGDSASEGQDANQYLEQLEAELRNGLWDGVIGGQLRSARRGSISNVGGDNARYDSDDEYGSDPAAASGSDPEGYDSGGEVNDPLVGSDEEYDSDDDSASEGQDANQYLEQLEAELRNGLWDGVIGGQLRSARRGSISNVGGDNARYDSDDEYGSDPAAASGSDSEGYDLGGEVDDPLAQFRNFATAPLTSRERRRQALDGRPDGDRLVEADDEYDSDQEGALNVGTDDEYDSDDAAELGGNSYFSSVEEFLAHADAAFATEVNDSTDSVTSTGDLPRHSDGNPREDSVNPGGAPAAVSPGRVRYSFFASRQSRESTASTGSYDEPNPTDSRDYSADELTPTDSTDELNPTAPSVTP